MMNNDLENLLKQCTSLVNKQDLNIAKKNFIKENVFKALENKKVTFEAIFIEKCKKVFGLVSIDRLEMAEIKEYIFENLPIRRKWYSFHFPLFQKKVWSLALLLVFIISTFGKFSLTTAPDVYAKEAVLYISAGNVELRRDGQSFKAENGMIIHQGDVIKTFDNTVSYISYPNGNNSNFGQDSSIFFQKLAFDPKNLTNSEVDISLSHGRLLNNVYNSILSDSKFKISANNVNVSAINAVFDVAINEVAEDKAVNVSVVNSFVDVDINKDNDEKVENKTVFKQEQMRIASNGDYQILSLNDAVKKDEWLATNIKKSGDKNSKIADNDTFSEELSNLISPIQDVVESILTDDKRESFQIEINDINVLFEKAAYNKQKGNIGLAQKYLDEIDLKMEDVFQNYSNIAGIADLQIKLSKFSSYYKKHKTTIISAQFYDDYLNTFNELQILLVKDEFVEKKSNIDKSLETVLLSLNQDDNSSMEADIEEYIQNLQSTFDFVSRINNQTAKDEFYSEYAEKTLNIFKSIFAKFSSNDDKESLHVAFNLQKKISGLFENYKFLDDKILNAYNEMQNVFINIDQEEDNNDSDIMLDQIDSNDGTKDAAVK